MKRLTCVGVVFLLLGSPLALGDAHTFTYRPPPGSHPKTVAVAGSFNNWSTTGDPLAPRPDGAYAKTVDLPEGVYQYKFVVNGDQWIVDPASDKDLEESDGYGGHNSAAVVGPDARKAHPPAPNAIDPAYVFFNPADPADVNVASADLVRFRLRTLAGDVQSITLTSDETPPQAMYKVGTRFGLDTYACFLKTDGRAQSLHYRFEIADGSARVVRGGPSGSDNPFQLKLEPSFATPDWAKNAVWYQIFPERFRNGDASNDPPGTQRWQSKWFTTLPGETPGDENFYKGTGNVWKRRFGGDVQGLIQALPYLKKLGVTAIYLNPIFEAESLHKYDATDYRHVDDNFGFKGDLAQLRGETDDPATWQWTRTDRLFLDFVDRAHQMGFKVVLDGVFNHVGREFWAFQDVLKNGRQSRYADWFDVRDWNAPIKYVAWDTGAEPSTDGSLPVFKKDPKLGLVHGPREHVLAIARRWLAPDGDPARGVDGFRLDVPGDVPHPFWVDFRSVVKTAKPDAYIVGELWGMSQPWLKGDQFDATMNYPFAMAMQDFFVNQKKAIPPTVFNARLNAVLYAYPLQVSLAEMNLLDSHDTDRFASMFVNPDLGYDGSNRLQDSGPRYSSTKPTAEQWLRMKQAIVAQFTLLGSPMIYYGDEAGMWSPDDPSNRQPMVWKDLEPFDDPAVRFDADLFDHYRRLIEIRNRFPALRTGFFRPLITDDSQSVFAFSRDLAGDRVIVAINRSPETRRITLDLGSDPGSWVDALSSVTSDNHGDRAESPSEPPRRPPIVLRDGHAQLVLEPYGSAVLTRASPTAPVSPR